MEVTNQDLIVWNGGGLYSDTGHRSHYPIFKDDNNVEHVYLDGHNPIRLDRLNFQMSKRETVQRG
jgi:hypothetical protein